MIKAVLRGKSGSAIVVFGIERMNVERLKEGRPIMVRGSDIGMPGREFLIMYGETLQDVQKELAAAGVDFSNAWTDG